MKTPCKGDVYYCQIKFSNNAYLQPASILNFDKGDRSAFIDGI